MKSLIVTSHPEPRSFNHAMAAAAAGALRSIGHRVTLLDLHADGFDPVIRMGQFAARNGAGLFEVMVEQAREAELGRASKQVEQSQALLREADNLVLQFPLWWWSLPAQLKGWIDRVFSAGFAYGGADLSGRRAMLTVTAETAAERFSAVGGEHPLHHIERGMLKFCGYEVMPAFVVADVYRLTFDQRSKWLDALADHVRRHFGPAVAHVDPNRKAL